MIPVAAFDTETTGTDPEQDRIVSAAIVLLDENGNVTDERTWLLNPGVPIPEEATKIHGITTEYAAEHGQEPGEALGDIVGTLHRVNEGDGMPLVIYNAPFDLTLLDREVRRHEASPFIGDIGGNDLGLWWDPYPVLDPYVIDKHIDRYRRGKRTLDVTAMHYTVPFEGEAHTARADAVTSARVMQRMWFPDEHRYAGDRVLAQARDLDALHQAQIGWKREQAASLAEYFAKQHYSDPYASGEPPLADGSWPFKHQP